MFSKIVVALDGSEYAAKALDIGVEIAKRFGASLTLVHVVPAASALITSPDVSTAPIMLDLSNELYQSGKRILDRGVEKAQAGGVPAATVLEHGDVSDHIISVAENEKADLIVIGERGLGSVTRFFLGSIANKVTYHAMCPVLIVKKM
ncbi:universal stress protein [Candidatus Bathyarchaeota archaeon]|nr:universal stress protein [Candidatus Bathyarchaeota archaeon]